ncbi:MAG: DUF5915 domain-containing protein [Myxococcota bacterium]
MPADRRGPRAADGDGARGRGPRSSGARGPSHQGPPAAALAHGRASRSGRARGRRGSSALVADELNVKQVVVEADESAFATVVVKPNFKTLGKRCGPKLKQIGPALAAWGFEEVARLEAGETIEVEGEALALGDVLLQRSARRARRRRPTASTRSCSIPPSTTRCAGKASPGTRSTSSIRSARKAASRSPIACGSPGPATIARSLARSRSTRRSSHGRSSRMTSRR